MAWELAGYAVAFLCLTAAAAIALAVVALLRSLDRWNAAVSRLDREAETALRQWRRLGREAAESAAKVGALLQGLEALAEGGRALGEAARHAARTAADAAHMWSGRIAQHMSEAAERQRRHIGEAIDWSETLWSLWQYARRRGSGAPNPPPGQKDECGRQ
ncbi:MULTISPECIES: hypothetical protein [Cohnella]|uniref:hypothetical protein n=1 Tax=Cohnella TaxID=329857 RepID=UPI000360106D|nr:MULTISPECIES: hypothetical protein [Cohnella]REK65382.1 MAG: hypothetical protein C6P35_10810 [Cohnella sp.]